MAAKSPRRRLEAVKQLGWDQTGKEIQVKSLQAMHAEGRGVYAVEIVLPGNTRFQHAILEVTDADRASRDRLMLSALEQAVTRRPKKKWPCLLCGRKLSRREEIAAWTVLLAATDLPTQAAVSSLCQGCAGKDGLPERVAKVYRNVIPDMRFIWSTNEAEEIRHYERLRQILGKTQI